VPSHSARPGRLGRRSGLATFTALALWTLAGALPASALDMNGFFPAPGGLDLALSYSTESYDHFWRGNQKVQNPAFLGEVENWSSSLWARYGLTDRFCLVGNLNYVDSSSDGSARFSDSGIQDLTALVVFKALEGGSTVRHRLVVAGGGRTPLSGYEGDSPVSLGDASTDALLRLVYQIEAGGFYASQQVGYDLRGDDVPDGIPLYTEAGYTVGRVTVNGFYLRYLADGGSDIGDPGFTFPGNQDETERVGAKVFARATERLGLFVGGYTTLDGRNSGDLTGYSAGFTLGF